MTLSLEIANDDGLRRLYAFYMRQLGQPFFIDVSGPPPMMRRERFAEYCTENDSAMLLCLRGQELVGCTHFRDKQPGLELANFDTVFFNGYPGADSDEARDFGASFRAACANQKLSRVQLLALKEESEKIALLESIGFKNEGVLREHYFFGGAYHDLVMLGWTSDDRAARLAALAEEDSDNAIPTSLTVTAKSTPKSSTMPGASPLQKGMLSRRVASDDAELLIRWYGDPLIQETIEDEELSPEGLRAKAGKLAGLDEFQDGECAFIIEFDGEPVALAHYMWFDWVSRTVELDFFLAPDLRAGPFMVRVVLREIGRIAFEGFHIHKMYGFTYANNDMSLRLNANFLETEAILKDYLPRAGGGADVHVQGMLASDYYRKFARAARIQKEPNGR